MLAIPRTILLIATTFLLSGTANAKRRDKQDPRDQALAELIRDVSGAIVAAAQGQPVEPRFCWSGGGFGITETKPEVAQQLTALGSDIQVVMTVLEVEGAAGDGTGPGYLRGSAVVLADGRVRWLAPSIRLKNPALGPTSGLPQASPALTGAVERLSETLSDPACALPLLTPADVAHIPAALAEALPMSPDRLQQACTVAAGGAFVWKPYVDDITVLVRVGDTHVALRSSFVVDTDRLLLEEVRVRAVE